MLCSAAPAFVLRWRRGSATSAASAGRCRLPWRSSCCYSSVLRRWRSRFAASASPTDLPSARTIRRMVEPAAVQAALRRALRGGGDFADCFVERRRSLLVSMEDSRVERVLSGIEQGAGVRVVSGQTTAFAYTDEVTEGSLLRAAENAASAARAGGSGEVIELGEPRDHSGQTVRIEPDAVDTARKVELLRRADQVA